MLILIGQVFLFILRIVVVQNDFDDLHGIVAHLFDFSLSTLSGLPSSLLTLFDSHTTQLELILLEVVIQVCQQLATRFEERSVSLGLFETTKQLSQTIDSFA